MVTLVRGGGSKKQKIVFLELKGDSYRFHSERNVDGDLEAYTIKDKTYRINKDYCAWTDGPLYFDIGNCDALLFEKLKEKRRPQDLANFMKSSALTRLVQGNLLKILLIAVGLMAVGIIITGAWGIYSVNQANKQLADITLKYMNATTGGLIH